MENSQFLYFLAEYNNQCYTKDDIRQLFSNSNEITFSTAFAIDDRYFVSVEFMSPKTMSEIELILFEEANLNQNCIKIPVKKYISKFNIQSYNCIYLTRFPNGLDYQKLNNIINSFCKTQPNHKKKRAYNQIILKDETDAKRILSCVPAIPFFKESRNHDSPPIPTSILVSLSCIDFPILRFSKIPVTISEENLKEIINSQLIDKNNPNENIEVLISMSKGKKTDQFKFANVLFDVDDEKLKQIIPKFNFAKFGNDTLYVYRFLEPEMALKVRKYLIEVKDLVFVSLDQPEMSNEEIQRNNTIQFYHKMVKYGEILTVQVIDNNGYVAFIFNDARERLFADKNFNASYAEIGLRVTNFPLNASVKDVAAYLEVPENQVIQEFGLCEFFTLPTFLVTYSHPDEVDYAIEKLDQKTLQNTKPFGVRKHVILSENEKAKEKVFEKFYESNTLFISPIPQDKIEEFNTLCTSFGIVIYFIVRKLKDKHFALVTYSSKDEYEKAFYGMNNFQFHGINFLVKEFNAKITNIEYFMSENLPNSNIPHPKKKKQQKPHFQNYPPPNPYPFQMGPMGHPMPEMGRPMGGPPNPLVFTGVFGPYGPPPPPWNSHPFPHPCNPLDDHHHSHTHRHGHHHDSRHFAFENHYANPPHHHHPMQHPMKPPVDYERGFYDSFMATFEEEEKNEVLQTDDISPSNENEPHVDSSSQTEEEAPSQRGRRGRGGRGERGRCRGERRGLGRDGRSFGRGGRGGRSNHSQEQPPIDPSNGDEAFIIQNNNEGRSQGGHEFFCERGRGSFVRGRGRGSGRGRGFIGGPRFGFYANPNNHDIRDERF
ncbi:hypothetical protein TRFO_04903 [Tritrichomonas foetus]|uniref:RRM domain-containing protein n=1 Tax=Tritrichomonas foetus TaxID=1144522 RepID=A0A1J4KFC1_9EUKA|nr:hypothetical protein TRFO_04903 [Tritrichomonas foetus]|eukprot:OHT08294.1 hypothetical protein TRFO_04903 [Tritrichomonas foetus]